MVVPGLTVRSWIILTLATVISSSLRRPGSRASSKSGSGVEPHRVARLPILASSSPCLIALSYRLGRLKVASRRSQVPNFCSSTTTLDETVELGAIAKMAPAGSHAVATAVSMQVLSHDETSILVEAGGFTPMRWFIERGAHHMQATTEDDEESEQPPKKRSKLAKSTKPRSTHKITPAAAMIPLARVTIDIHFPETLSTKAPMPETIDQDADFSSSDGIPVMVNSITEDDGGVQIILAHPTQEGAVLKADLSHVPSQVLDNLRTFAPSDRQNASLNGHSTKDHPASITRCLLKRSMGELYNVVRLEGSIAWRDGASAFPAGVPVGKARVYPDYELKARFFPDESRNEAEHAKSWTPRDFYDSVHIPDRKSNCDLGDVLASQLYPFQERAVSWMLGREGVTFQDGKTVMIPMADLKDPDTIQFKEARDLNGDICYVNHLQAVVSRHKPEPNTQRMTGGLLALDVRGLFARLHHLR